MKKQDLKLEPNVHRLSSSSLGPAETEYNEKLQKEEAKHTYKLKAWKISSKGIRDHITLWVSYTFLLNVYPNYNFIPLFWTNYKYILITYKFITNESTLLILLKNVYQRIAISHYIIYNLPKIYFCMSSVLFNIIYL